MLINCQISTRLWIRLESWINEIMVSQYTLTNKKKFLGEQDKAHWINIVILNTKKSHIFVQVAKLYTKLV